MYKPNPNPQYSYDALPLAFFEGVFFGALTSVVGLAFKPPHVRPLTLASKKPWAGCHAFHYSAPQEPAVGLFEARHRGVAQAAPSGLGLWG